MTIDDLSLPTRLLRTSWFRIRRLNPAWDLSELRGLLADCGGAEERMLRTGQG